MTAPDPWDSGGGLICYCGQPVACFHAARLALRPERYDLDELTAENGSVLGDLSDTSEATLALSPDLADDLRRRTKQINASLEEGYR